MQIFFFLILLIELSRNIFNYIGRMSAQRIHREGFKRIQIHLGKEILKIDHHPAEDIHHIAMYLAIVRRCSDNCCAFEPDDAGRGNIACPCRTLLYNQAERFGESPGRIIRSASFRIFNNKSFILVRI